MTPSAVVHLLHHAARSTGSDRRMHRKGSRSPHDTSQYLAHAYAKLRPRHELERWAVREHAIEHQKLTIRADGLDNALLRPALAPVGVHEFVSDGAEVKFCRLLQHHLFRLRFDDRAVILHWRSELSYLQIHVDYSLLCKERWGQIPAPLCSVTMLIRLCQHARNGSTPWKHSVHFSGSFLIP